jgi:hypothetical protein
LKDAPADVREEAMAGLAKRLDTRVLPSLLDALEQPGVSDCVVEAADTLLGLDHDRKEWSGGDYVTALRQRFRM